MSARALRRLAVLAALAAPAACADDPAATLVFAPLGDPDNCAASEAEIVSATESLWLGLRRAGTTIASTCLSVEGASTWKDLEDALVHAGPLVDDLPLGAPLRPFVMGLPGAGACPDTDPTGGIRFCARAEADFEIDAEDGGGTVSLRRICPAAWSAQDCFGE